MCRRCVLEETQVPCSALCRGMEDMDHLFFKCDYYGRLWLSILDWLGITIVSQGDVISHSTHFGGLGGFSRNSRTMFTIIWISVLFIIWKDLNMRIFNNQTDQLEVLAEKVKLQTYWWFKPHCIMFDFDYHSWRRQPLCCLQAVV